MQSLRRAAWRSSLKHERASRAKPSLVHRQPFTQYRPLLLSRIPQRTQLPYLHSAFRQGGQQEQLRSYRLFTIRDPKNFKDLVVAFLQVGVVFYTVLGLYKVIQWGVRQEVFERSQATPHEYSRKARIKLREGLGEEEQATTGTAIPNWKKTGDKFTAAIDLLEDRDGDGKAVQGVLGENEDIYVAGIGRTGLDVSACSEPWRRGYFQALMGAGRCSERLDGWVYDRTTGKTCASEHVVGPSNPNPTPLPPVRRAADLRKPPLEENCEPAFAPPEKYYLKAITTRGFSVSQRLRAALAYADWLRYKNLHEAAHGMHSWAVDIALENAPGEKTALIDSETGVFKPEITTLTPNLLLAAEAFGTHFATTGDMAAALPVYLSILRAQQNLPPPPQLEAPKYEEPANPYWEFVLKTVLPPKYPAPPPSGDDPMTQTPESVCASTRTMAHIGEVLFASDLAALSLEPTPSSDALAASPHPLPTTPTSTQSAGLAWTRQAADLAEATLHAVDPDSGPERYLNHAQNQRAPTPSQRAARHRTHQQQTHCAACLGLALDNWRQMVERFERAEQTAARARLRKADAPLSAEQVAQRAADVRATMQAAYARGARPDDVLAQVEAATQAAEARAERAAVARREAKAEEAEATARAERARRGEGGWGMFWSGRLGLAGPTTPAEATAEHPEQGPWEVEAGRVRTRQWEARLLARQLGLME